MNAKIEAPELARSDILQRPPHGRIVGSTTKPLIVTPTFVSRTDATPEGERPHDVGSGVNRAGLEVAHPDRRPSALALEPDPNRALEHWDAYRRKVHGPKFAYRDPGTANDKVLRYDQVHPFGSTTEDPEGSKIDGISVLSFACLNDVEDYLVGVRFGPGRHPRRARCR